MSILPQNVIDAVRSLKETRTWSDSSSLEELFSAIDPATADAKVIANCLVIVEYIRS